MIRVLIKITLALSKRLLDKKGIIMGTSRLAAENQLIKHIMYYQCTELNHNSNKKQLKCSMIKIFMLLSPNRRVKKKKKKEEITLFQSHVLTNTED